MLARRFLLLAIVVVTVPLVGQQHPNIERGFQADKVYQFNGIDDVNLYNGNLSLTIPIGNDYPGNGALNYRLALTYNSKAWDQEIYIYENIADCWRPPGSEIPPHVWCGRPYIKTVPSRRSNAGMGWSLSLGRLLSPSDPVVNPGPAGSGMPFWIYEGPDGADHSFSMTDPANSSIRHTRDGSLLRLVPLGADRYEVHFPDGMIHTFAPVAGAYSPRLEEIRDPFGNHLNVVYGTDGNWTLREYAATGALIREHYVRFRDITAVPDAPEHAPVNYDFVLDEVNLAAFGGARAIHSFQYTTDEIQYGCYGDWRNTETPNPKVPRLRQVVLPDQSKWEADYFNWGCSSIQALVLPTKGRMEWTYMTYLMPTAGCRTWEVPDTDSRSSPFSDVEGVATKKVISTDGAESLWTYAQTPELLSPYVVLCATSNGNFPVPKHQQSKVAVTSPDGTKIENFFSIWDDAASPPEVLFDRSEYGLPLTRGPNSGCLSDPAALCLSSIQYDCRSGQCVPARSRYVKYEGESRYSAVGYEEFGYRREVANRTVFHDDGDRHVQTLRSRYDGLGHFRTVTTSDSWSGLSREETTNYNPTRPDVTVNSTTWENSPANNRPTPNESWFLSLFDSKSVSEAGQSAISHFCFNDVTGFLKRQRVLKGASPGPNDLLHVFSSDSNGNVSREEYFGGDQQAVSTAALCTIDPPLHNEYSFRIDHTHQYGSLAMSTYWNTLTNAPMSFQSVDRTIDKNTGLASRTRDTPGLATETAYSYDLLGRITSVQPPTGVAATSYTYTNATSSNPAGVDITTSSTTGTLRSQVVFDGLGRVLRESRLLPSETEWAASETGYDAVGRIAWKSEPESTAGNPPNGALLAPHKTQYSYDPFGRPTRVTQPDNTSAVLEYIGDRIRERTASLSTAVGAPDSLFTSTEEYDASGRLISVTQRSGPTSSSGVVGGSVTTAYGYDVGNRLRSVKMTGAESVVQNRIFDYDHRGLLRWESHPESGMTSYTYDARGHVLTKSRGAANTLFDQRYSYDSAERLLQVDARNPLYNPNSAVEDERQEFRPLKKYSFAPENDLTPVPPEDDDLRKGKLVSAIRYNYPPVPGYWGPEYLGFDIIRVTETYQYRDVAGRRTRRSTVLDKTTSLAGNTWQLIRNFQQSVFYNDLDLPSLIKYPICLDCGMPPFNPERNLEPSYRQGRLKTVPGFITDASYWVNGMRNVLLHANSVADTQLLDGAATAPKMPRPSVLSSALYNACIAPIILSEPAGGKIDQGTSSVILSVSASGTSLTYQWYNGTTWQPITGETGTTLTVSPSVTTTYFVEITNACKTVRSRQAEVAVNECVQPWIISSNATLNPDRTVTLYAVGGGTEPFTFKWHRASDDALVGTGAKVTTGPIVQTAGYYVKITNSCGGTGGQSSIHTVSVPLPMPTVGLAATKTGSTQITVSWPTVVGAASYKVERRSGSGWNERTATSLTQFIDAGLLPDTTYAYRVYAIDGNGSSTSAYSNVDVATTMTFTTVSSGMSLSANYFEELLDAVNYVRAAAGWAPVTWASILARNEPIPEPQVVILAAHINALRARMNEALQALGAAAGGYTDPDPKLVLFSPVHITELQTRAQ